MYSPPVSGGRSSTHDPQTTHRNPRPAATQDQSNPGMQRMHELMTDGNGGMPTR